MFDLIAVYNIDIMSLSQNSLHYRPSDPTQNLTATS